MTRIRTDLLYHVPGQGHVTLPAGTRVHVLDEEHLTDAQLRLVESARRTRIVQLDDHTSTVPGRKFAVIRWPDGFGSHPEGWTTVPAEVLS